MNNEAIPFYMGKYIVPAPVKHLEIGQEYWVFGIAGVERYRWADDIIDHCNLKDNTIRTSKKDAQSCCRALRKILKGE
jgi:hypothetical protein